jgi:hypothetical protein
LKTKVSVAVPLTATSPLRSGPKEVGLPVTNRSGENDSVLVRTASGGSMTRTRGVRRVASSWDSERQRGGGRERECVCVC